MEIKALRKAENSEFCSFAKFGIVWLPKFGIFLEIIISFVIPKVWQNLTKILTKIKTINNRIYTLKSGSIKKLLFLDFMLKILKKFLECRALRAL